MMRIAALNDASSVVSDEEDIGPSQEVLEADATRVYRKAIHLMANEEFLNAKCAFEEVLNNPYIAKVSLFKMFFFIVIYMHYILFKCFF